MPCLLCRYWSTPQPDDWTPSYESDSWEDVDNIQTYVYKKRIYLTGECCLEPQHTEVRLDHVCSHIDVIHNWRSAKLPQHVSDSQSVREWSTIALNLFFNGSWDDQRYKRMQEDVTKLRAQLAASRKVSASRLARLKNGSDPAPESPPESPQ